MISFKSILLLISLFAFFFLIGCAGTRMPKPVPMATVQGLSSHFRVGQIVALKEGKTLSFDELVQRIAPKDLIFVGEVHDNPEHHLIQVQILQALIASPGPLVVAMEFFQQGHQAALDRYLQGEITEEEFLRDVDWRETWSYDYLLYRPLLQIAKEKGIRVLALNAPAAIVKKVAREGLKGLDPDERDQLPRDIDLTVEAHRAYLRSIYGRHSHENLKDFEYFYEAQCVWEETMARNLSKYQREGGERLVVFAGNGHIIHKFGIPDRTIRRFPGAMVTIMPYPIGKREAIEKETADYVWLTPDYPHRPVRPSMGERRP